MKCLLCKLDNVTIIESIPKNEIVRLWLSNDVNVYDEIKTPVVHKYHCHNCELSFFDPANAGGDKFYSRLAEYEWYYKHPGKTEYDYVQQWIKEDDHVLDVGSGRGELFNRTSKKINYTGLELSTKAVELAKEAGINVLQQDLVEHAEQNPAKYDIACLFQVLEHLTELDEFINAIKKSLKPGGYLCVAVPNNDGFLSYVVNNAFNMPPHHTLLWNKKSLETLGKIFGLSIVDVHFEKLQEVHRDWFVSSLITKKVRTLLKRKHHTINFGFGYSKTSEMVNKARKSGLLGKFINKMVLSKEQSGHSIIVVFQKPLET